MTGLLSTVAGSDVAIMVKVCLASDARDELLAKNTAVWNLLVGPARRDDLAYRLSGLESNGFRHRTHLEKTTGEADV